MKKLFATKAKTHRDHNPDRIVETPISKRVTREEIQNLFASELFIAKRLA